MDAAQIITALNNDGFTVRSENGKLIVEPRLKADRSALLKAHKVAVLLELERFPGRTAKARSFSISSGTPPRADEIGPQPRRPVAVLSRNPWSRLRRRRR